ncbi:MAG: DHHA1 domain-containing protein [Bacilli bacterium]|nr:DHHA1 domain-containing protein [Bacilli bacterium]
MKDLLISHIEDVDGLSPVILLKLCQRDFDYKLLEIKEVEPYLNQLLEEDLTQYENIYITDLTVPEEIYKKIQVHPCQQKFKVFDHHKTHLYGNGYPNVIIDTKECATTLFYQYLKNKYPNTDIGKQNVKEYIEHVKDLDIWLWVAKQNETAPKLGSLFGFYGEEKYIEKTYKRLQEENTFTFNDFEQEYFILEEEKKKKYIEKREDKMFFIKIENYKAGVLFAEKYRNEMAEVLSQKYPMLDMIITINVNGGISFRTIKEDVDLSLFASKYGGGGHAKAAGAPVTIEMKENILKQILKGCEMDASR